MNSSEMPPEEETRTTEHKTFDMVGQFSKAGHLGRPVVDRLFRRWLTPPDHRDWVVDAEWARIQQEPTHARRLLWAIVITFVALLVWAANAPIDEIARGDGKVIPSRQLQVLQSIDGGIVQSIPVREGDIVEPGQLLVALDSTRFLSNFRESRAKYLAVSAEVSRLEALTGETELKFSEEVSEEAPELVAQERVLYQTSLDELKSQVAIHKQQLQQRQQDLEEARSNLEQFNETLELANRELEVTRPLLAIGAVSEVEMIRLERDVTSARGEVRKAHADIARTQAAIEEAQAKIQEVEVRMKNQWRNQLAESSAQLKALENAETGLADRVQQTEIRSQVKGKIQRLKTNTLGGVVTPGSDVVEILPLDDQLIIEARIAPKDIAFIHPGQEAMIKFTAYDFAIYGGLKADVTHISPDTITDEDNNTYYQVRLKTREQGFDENLPIIPGMTTQVDITTGQKTVLEYLLKPILRATDKALSER